jgi:hypothetical protein
VITEHAVAVPTGRARADQEFVAVAFGRRFYFPWFAGLIYRDHRRYTLSWSGEASEPVKVQKWD